MVRRAMSLMFLTLVILSGRLVVIAPALAAEATAGKRVAVESGGSYTEVTALDLRTMLTRKDFVLVNVHIPYAGEIDHTDRFIPFNEIQTKLGALPPRKDAKIVLYCSSGPMSVIAARRLVKLGYTNVSTLGGGMVAWKAAGFEVQDRHR